MNNRLEVRNRQRVYRLNCRLLHRIAREFLSELMPIESYELEINVVSGAEMAHLNESFLHHRGITDVLAFDYRESESKLIGEVFVCADEAATQAVRFRTSWQSELVRYMVHGTLHLAGYRDHQPTARLKMKALEDQVLQQLASRFDFARIGSGGLPTPPKRALPA